MENTMRLMILMVVFIALSSIAFSATIRVPANYPTIQSAIDASSNGDTILVSPGTYPEYIDFLGKSILLKSQMGAENTVIDAQDAWCVVTFSQGEDENSVLNGFTLTNGHGGGYPNYIGGGITCKYSSPKIFNNIITHNRAGGSPYHFGDGGAIYCETASPTIMNNTITYNTATYNCAGIYCRNESNPMIVDNYLAYNVGYVSGAIYCQYNSSPFIENNTIHANVATNGCEGWGAGIFCFDHSNPRIFGNVITDNEANKPGAGIACREYSNPKIHNNYIAGNVGTKSCGGILAELSSPEIIGNVIEGNTCFKWGGGIEINGSASLVANNIICNNISTGEYGGYGAGIYIHGGSNPTLLNNTFYGNTGTEQGGGISCATGSSVVIKNSIFWNNSAPDGHEIFIDSTATVNLSHSNVQGGQSDISANGGILVWGSGMLDLDPGFIDAAAKDFHLTFNSPCRNQGDGAVLVVLDEDIDGNPREAYGDVDIGADEFYDHFYCTDRCAPGEVARAAFIGYPGSSPVGFWIGSGILETPMPSKFGDWYLKFPVLDVIVLPSIPANGYMTLNATVPLTPAGPYKVPMQALIGTDLTSYSVLDVGF